MIGRIWYIKPHLAHLALVGQIMGNTSAVPFQGTQTHQPESTYSISKFDPALVYEKGETAPFVRGVIPGDVIEITTKRQGKEFFRVLRQGFEPLGTLRLGQLNELY